jgi:hypothetical protein
MTPWPTLAAHHHGLTPEAFLARYEAAVDPTPETAQPWGDSDELVTLTPGQLAALVAATKALVEHWPVSA